MRGRARTALNIAIVLALAGLVAFLPEAGVAADLLSWLLWVIFLGVLAWFASTMYRRYRDTLFAIGERNRAVLYGAVAVTAVTLSATDRLWDTGPGTLLWFGLIGASVMAVIGVVTAWRAE